MEYYHLHLIYRKDSSLPTQFLTFIDEMKLMQQTKYFLICLPCLPWMDGGETSAHIFVGHNSKTTDIYKAKDNSGKEFVGAFHDQVCTRGVPTKLVTHNVLMYRGWKVTKFLRDIITPLWQCETKYQYQNLAENRYETVKRHTNRTMDRSGAPPAAWVLCLVYICFCLSNCFDPNLGDGTKSPLMMACFTQNDISPLLFFFF